MANNPQAASKSKESTLFSLRVVLFLALAIALGGGFWYLEKAGPPQPKGPVLTPEAKAYTRRLTLNEVSMKATENAIHQAVVEVEGKITNTGDRHLRSVLLSCIFYDANGQIILKERVEIVRAKFGGIKPGETKTFRLPFDNLPASWNQRMPQLVIAEIIFG